MEGEVREIQFQVILENKIIGEIGTMKHFNSGLWWFVDYRLPEDERVLDGGFGHLFPHVKNQMLNPLTYREYIGLHDSKRTKEYPEGQEIYNLDIVDDTYLLYVDLVYGLHLIDISNGAIMRYREGIIDDITGNYFEQHEKISKECQGSFDQLVSQTEGKV